MRCVVSTINSATGKYTINPQFQQALSFSDGLAAVMQDDRWGYVDTTGNFSISPQFDKAYGFVNGIALVGFGDLGSIKWGFIDKTGKLLLNPTFDDAWFFQKT